MSTLHTRSVVSATRTTCSTFAPRKAAARTSPRQRFAGSGSSRVSRVRSGRHSAMTWSPAETPSDGMPRIGPIAVSTSATPPPTDVTVPTSSFDVPTKFAT